MDGYQYDYTAYYIACPRCGALSSGRNVRCGRCNATINERR